jgi:hypothetical protein
MRDDDTGWGRTWRRHQCEVDDECRKAFWSICNSAGFGVFRSLADNAAEHWWTGNYDNRPLVCALVHTPARGCPCMLWAKQECCAYCPGWRSQIAELAVLCVPCCFAAAVLAAQDVSVTQCQDSRRWCILVPHLPTCSPSWLQVAACWFHGGKGE